MAETDDKHRFTMRLDEADWKKVAKEARRQDRSIRWLAENIIKQFFANNK
jgi:predicted HicB family RNase H-like nuclease